MTFNDTNTDDGRFDQPAPEEVPFEKPDQEVYQDAHYVPHGTYPDPPRYYAPPEHHDKPPKEKSGDKGRGLTACLIAAALLVGCAAGAIVTRRRADARINDLSASISTLEGRLDTVEKDVKTASEIADAFTPGSASADGASFTPEQIYALACNEVVGITTSVTYTNFFGQTSSSAVSGSGIIISEDGYILTNYHVIEYAYQYGYEISVMLYDGSKYTAQIVGTEEYNDLAVLKIAATGLDSAALGDSSSLKVGEAVYAVGNPLGELDFSLTTGRVSALDRRITTDESDTAINMFQIDAAVNKGNSGGPVYDAGGRVVGVVTAKYSETGVEGIGFAIPINDAEYIANELMEKGYVSGKASLSLECDERYNYIYSRWYNLPEGAYVSSVDKGGCAERAGIQSGDIIVYIGETRITSDTDLAREIRKYKAGETAEITFYRSGGTAAVSVVLDEAGADDSEAGTA